MRRGLEIFFRLLLPTLLLGFLAGCSSPKGDEAQVRERLESLVSAVENRDAGGVTNFLAEDFSGPAGMTRELAEAYARTMMSRYSELGVTWTIGSLEIVDNRAQAQLNVMLTGKSLLPGFEGRGRLMIVDLGWRKDNGKWMVVNAQWRGTLDNQKR